TDHDPRMIEVWNKIDAVADEDRAKIRRDAAADPRVVLVSAVTGAGLDDLRERIQAIIARDYQREIFRIPVSEGKAQAWLYAHADVIDKKIDNETLVLEAKIAPAMHDKSRALYPDIESITA